MDFLSVETQIKFMQEGINWDELRMSDKENLFKDTFADENGDIPKAINSSALNSWV